MTHKRTVAIPMPCCAKPATIAVSVDILEPHIGTEVSLDVPVGTGDHDAACPLCGADWDTETLCAVEVVAEDAVMGLVMAEMGTEPEDHDQ